MLRDPAGRGGSLHVHDRLAVGDVVRVRGPRNHFPLVPSPRYLFIAGGIGITPVLPMVRAAEAAGADWELVYGGRQRASMAFLDELAAYGDRVRGPAAGRDGPARPGRACSARPASGPAVYCCGPEPLLAAVEQRCATWPAGALHVERFAPRPQDPDAPAAAFEVELARSGPRAPGPRRTARSSRSSRQAGVDVLSSCSEGTCGTCETAVLDGVPDHRDSVLDEAERRAGDLPDDLRLPRAAAPGWSSTCDPPPPPRRTA